MLLLNTIEAGDAEDDDDDDDDDDSEDPEAAVESELYFASLLLLLTSLQGIVTAAWLPRMDGMIVVKLTGTNSEIVVFEIPVMNSSAGEVVVGISLDAIIGAIVV